MSSKSDNRSVTIPSQTPVEQLSSKPADITLEGKNVKQTDRRVNRETVRNFEWLRTGKARPFRHCISLASAKRCEMEGYDPREGLDMVERSLETISTTRREVSGAPLPHQVVAIEEKLLELSQSSMGFSDFNFATDLVAWLDLELKPFK